MATNGHRKWPRCVRSSFGLRPRRECWLNLVEKCGLGPRVVVIVGLAHVLSGQFAFRQLVLSARGRCVEDRIIGASTLSAADPVIWPGCVCAWLCTSAKGKVSRLAGPAGPPARLGTVQPRVHRYPAPHRAVDKPPDQSEQHHHRSPLSAAMAERRRSPSTGSSSSWSRG
jgi:hypothetical protein